MSDVTTAYRSALHASNNEAAASPACSLGSNWCSFFAQGDFPPLVLRLGSRSTLDAFSGRRGSFIVKRGRRQARHRQLRARRARRRGRGSYFMGQGERQWLHDSDSQDPDLKSHFSSWRQSSEGEIRFFTLNIRPRAEGFTAPGPISWELPAPSQ